MNPREICERYEKLYTGAVADILDEKGFRKQCLGPALRPLFPDRRAAGFAFPALGEACADVGYDCRPEILTFLGAIPAESMVVFDPGKEKVCAAWGEFMALAARNNGCRGVVVDGPIRDAEMTMQAGFQIFGTGFWPVSSVGRWRPVHVGRPILFHGVEVRPGDLVLGDIDGVVVVPRPLVEEVLLAAEECFRAERSMKEELRAGKTMAEVFAKYGRW
ncbi:MAG: RraA family protein [candidate division NC10 bacterium]|nr:RraA family protein [candidate division NC10 bacterium]